MAVTPFIVPWHSDIGLSGHTTKFYTSLSLSSYLNKDIRCQNYPAVMSDYRSQRTSRLVNKGKLSS